MKSVLSRIELLEASRRTDPLIILTVDSDGNEKKTTVSEMLQSGNYDFVRVLSGNNMADLDRLLSAFRERALKAAEGVVDDG